MVHFARLLIESSIREWSKEEKSYSKVLSWILLFVDRLHFSDYIGCYLSRVEGC